jgi:hypothetical protein
MSAECESESESVSESEKFFGGSESKTESEKKVFGSATLLFGRIRILALINDTILTFLVCVKANNTFQITVV